MKKLIIIISIIIIGGLAFAGCDSPKDGSNPESLTENSSQENTEKLKISGDKEEKATFIDTYQPYSSNITLNEESEYKLPGLSHSVALDNKHFVIAYSRGYYSKELSRNVVEHIIRLGTVENDAVLLNNENARLKEGAEFIRIVSLSTDRFIVLYRTGTAGINSLAGGGDGRAVLGKVTNGEIVLEEPVAFGEGIKHYGGFIHATALNENQFLVVYPRGFNGGLIVLGTVKGDAIHFTEETIFYSDYTTVNAFVEELSDDSFVIMFNDSGHKYITIGTVRGEVLSLGEKQEYFVDDRYLRIKSTAATGDGRFFILFESSSGDKGYYGTVGSASNGKIVFGEPIKILRKTTIKTMTVDQLDANRFVICYESFKNGQYYTTDIFVATLQKNAVTMSEHINIPEVYAHPIITGINADTFVFVYGVYLEYSSKEPADRAVVGKLQ